MFVISRLSLFEAAVSALPQEQQRRPEVASTLYKQCVASAESAVGVSEGCSVAATAAAAAAVAVVAIRQSTSSQSPSSSVTSDDNTTQ